MKKYFLPTILLTYFICAPCAFALTRSNSSTNEHQEFKAIKVQNINSDKNSTTASETKVQSAITKLITKGQNEIKIRIKTLTNLIERISKIKRLSDEQKAVLQSMAQSEITGFQSLNDKIASDTDLQTLQADIKSIFSSHRVYLFLIPKMQIIISSDMLSNTQKGLSELAIKLQNRITEAINNGEDVTNLETLLSDMQDKLKDTKVLEEKAVSSIENLTPTGYPSNKTDLKNARTYLQNAKKNLKSALEDARKISQQLHKLTKNTTPGISPSILPTTSPTAQ